MTKPVLCLLRDSKPHRVSKWGTPLLSFQVAQLRPKKNAAFEGAGILVAKEPSEIPFLLRAQK